MTFIPAHKHLGDECKPGQLRNERFLSEYIARKADDFDYFKPYQKKEPKLTFEEWIKPFLLTKDTKQFMRFAWNAAIEYGKV